MVSVLFLLFFVLGAFGHPNYRDNIPNGYTVPNPGPQGGIWAGVGHEAAGGGGPRNPFGKDFQAQKHEWTLELCRLDSDSDGRSNGVELGDPRCVWTKGGKEPEFPAQSHPGIPDEPIHLENNPGMCNGYVAPDDVLTMDIVFTEPNYIDEARTHYFCEQKVIEAPLDDVNTYHQIKTEILLDNEHVLHHMWIYLCNHNSSDGYKVGEGQYSCSGMEGTCDIVAGWAVGSDPWCEPPNVGAWIKFPRGSRSLTMKIEAHYDNTYHVPQMDQSGIRIHLTPTLRPLNNGMVILGMDYWDRQFKIPAREEAYALVNICPSSATELLTRPLWVYSWTPHMHLYGKKLLTEHYRCGEKIGQIGQIDDWEFNNQQSYLLPSPIKILPGDSIVTTCVYNTSTSRKAILGGESTETEMCDNYLTYYPWAGTALHGDMFTECVSFKRGLDPKYAGAHIYDLTSFAIMNIAGDLYVKNWEVDPLKNFGSCCDVGCEEKYLSKIGNACGVDSDCRQPAACVGGLCAKI